MADHGCGGGESQAEPLPAETDKPEAEADSKQAGQKPSKNKKAKKKAKLEEALLGAKSAADAEAAEKLRERGNDSFKKQRYQEALDLYKEASSLQPRNPAAWLNRSIANRHLESWEEALKDADMVLELQPDHCKALYSRALALQALRRLPEALEACKAGLDADAGNKALLQLRSALDRQISEASEKAKAANDCPASQLPEADLKKIMAKAKSAAYEWKGHTPPKQEREGLKQAMIEMFREKYAELADAREEIAATAISKTSKLQTEQYSKEQKLGLQLTGGHRPIPRPEHVDLPEKYKEAMGVMSVEQLRQYSWENPQRRYMISVYGNIFDVSDRPDKYGPDGPYTVLTGVDITWCFAAGVDSEEYTNRFYDLFKARDMGADKMGGVCSWLGWYWTEYGDPIGKLEPYTREEELPAPPMEELEGACCLM